MEELFTTYLPNVIKIPNKLLESTLETLYMVSFSALIGGGLGIVLGIMLVATGKGGVYENRAFYSILDKIINLLRSIPFVILLALIYPLTRLIVGTTLGLNAALVPLTIGFAPFFARQIENALLEVDRGIVEATLAMGSSPIEILVSVYLKEGLPGIIRASAVSIISLINLTAMAGAIGAGGLGNLAISVGYNNFQIDVAIVSTLIILVIVFITQVFFSFLARRVQH